MKPIYYKQETGDTEMFLCPGAPWDPAQFQVLCIHSSLHLTFATVLEVDMYG